MNMKVALCQIPCVENDPAANASSVVEVLKEGGADLYIFPELFLTGYGSLDYSGMKDSVEASLKKILETTKEVGAGVIVGAPTYADGNVYDSAVLIQGEIAEYRKLNLAHFQSFTEKDRFVPGDNPVMIRYGGFNIGLTICYDVFFPELFKLYAMNGADAVVCISASPVTSKKAFDRVLSARSVENTVYTLYVNNIGYSGELRFSGNSRCISPDGDEMVRLDDGEDIAIIELSHEDVEDARTLRPTLADTRKDIDWCKSERY